MIENDAQENFLFKKKYAEWVVSGLVYNFCGQAAKLGYVHTGTGSKWFRSKNRDG